jgi:hypothetical protein
MNSRGSRLLAAVVSVSTLVASAVITASPSFAATTDTAQTFAATGSVQTWTVPDGVTQVYVDISGAEGGAAYGGGGRGAELTGTISVTPGDTLHIIVGSMGQNGTVYSAGAGGGGGSFVYTTADQNGILAAAGGGGGAGSNTFPSSASTGTSGLAGGNGGGAGGIDGNGGNAGSDYSGAVGGGGGLLTNGGGGASGGHAVATGASGGAGGSYGRGGGFGGGGAATGYAGAGGGGYSGGGGGTFNYYNNGGGGGGGSYFSGTLTGAVNNHGGNGSVTLYYPSNLTSISPAAAAPGTSVTIDGSGLAGATVTIGGAAATVTSSTDTQVVATVPAPSPLPTGAQTVNVTTAGGVTLPAVGSFTYLSPPVFTADTPTSPATVGTPYSYTFTASGRPDPTFEVSSGTLPAGLTLTSGGVLSGTPTASGSSTFTVTASNGVSPDASTGDQTITVGQGAQTITFAPLASPATVGDEQSLNAVGGASGNPVTFAVAPSTTGSACSISGTTLSFDNAGSCVVVADQEGNADYAAAPEVTQVVSVAPASTSVSVALSLGESVFGQDVTATATVGGPQDGSIQFSVDGNDLGAPVTVSNGQATSPAMGNLAPGGHQVGAVFTPLEATKYAPSSATPQPLVVDQAATTSTLTVRAGSLTASIAPVSPGAGTPTGSVTFTVDGTPVGDATLDAGIATLSYSLPTGKADEVAVQYLGDANFLPSSASTTREDPTITVTLVSARPKSASGWYRTPVTARFTCTPNGAALVSECPQPVTFSSDGAAQSVSRTITAVDGGAATVSITGINIDQARPTVAITGVGTRRPYFASAPRGRCAARDGLSGVASCSIGHRRIGARVVYTATATDTAGNVSTTRLTARVARYVIKGASFRKGVYVVRAGRTYTILAAGRSRPRYVDAMPVPRAPRGLDNRFIKSGRNRWAIGVTFSTAMLKQRHWHIGVRVSGRTHVLTVRVVR